MQCIFGITERDAEEFNELEIVPSHGGACTCNSQRKTSNRWNLCQNW